MKMIKEGKFGFSEAVSLTILLLITKVFYTSPMLLTKSIGTASWYMPIVSCGTSVLYFLLIYLLMKRFPGKNLVEVFEEVLGKVVGKIIAMLFCIYTVYYAAMNLREFLEILKSYILPYTPPSLIFTAFLTIVCLLAYLGLETIARVSYLGIFAVLGGLAVLLALANTYYNFDALKPLLGYGIDRTILHGIIRSSSYSEIVFLAVIINSLHGHKNFKKVGLTGLVASGLILSTTLFFHNMAFGYTVGSENLSGLFQLSRIIYLSRFVQRVEAIFLFIWVITSVVAVSITFYISISIYCKVFSIRNRRPLILPFAILVFMVAILPKNISEVILIHMTVIREYSFIFVFCVPILVLIISLIFGKKGGEAANEKN